MIRHRSDPDWRFAIVHNGIVTNYKELRDQLAAVSLDWEGETDTEVVAKLTMHLYDQNPSITFDHLARLLAGRLEGAFSFLIKSTHFPGEVIAIKKGSPLIVGLNEEATKGLQSLRVSYVSKEEERPHTNGVNINGVDGSHDTAHSNGTNGNLVTNEANVATSSVWSNEFLFASDPSAIAEYTKKMVFLEDGDIAHVHSGYLNLYNTGDLDDPSTERKIQMFDHLDGSIPSKGTHAHYMQKEIYEQPDTIEAAVRSRINPKSDQINFPGLLPYMDRIRACAKIHFIACGSSYYACLAMQELFENVVGVDVSFDIASAFLDKSPRISTNVAYVFVSQSGETAECLSALQHCQKYGALTIGIVNVVDSSIARGTQCGIYINAGVEIGVATTKAYTSQLVHLALLALALGERNDSTLEHRLKIIQGLRNLPAQMQTMLAMDKEIKELCATKLMHKGHMLVLGRGYQHATALETSLKVKEVAYIHCEAVLTGELKHGVLALVDDSVSVVMIATRDRSFLRSLNGYEQRQ